MVTLVFCHVTMCGEVLLRRLSILLRATLVELSLPSRRIGLMRMRADLKPSGKVPGITCTHVHVMPLGSCVRERENGFAPVKSNIIP
jgi:hypothetical protein